MRAAERVRNYPAYGVKVGRKGKRGRKGGWVEAYCVIDSGNALVLHAVEGGRTDRRRRQTISPPRAVESRPGWVLGDKQGDMRAQCQL